MDGTTPQNLPYRTAWDRIRVHFGPSFCLNNSRQEMNPNFIVSRYKFISHRYTVLPSISHRAPVTILNQTGRIQRKSRISSHGSPVWILEFLGQLLSVDGDHRTCVKSIHYQINTRSNASQVESLDEVPLRSCNPFVLGFVHPGSQTPV